MSATTLARMRSCRSGGKAAGSAARRRTIRTVRLNLTRSGVDAALGGGPADQGGDGPVGEQVPVVLLADHVRAPGPQHAPGAAQAGLELGVPGLAARIPQRIPRLAALIRTPIPARFVSLWPYSWCRRNCGKCQARRSPAWRERGSSRCKAISMTLTAKDQDPHPERRHFAPGAPASRTPGP